MVQSMLSIPGIDCKPANEIVLYVIECDLGICRAQERVELKTQYLCPWDCLPTIDRLYGVDVCTTSCAVIWAWQ